MLRADLLEAGEAAAVVGAILWLAETIVEALKPGELHAWLRRAGLAGPIGELKSEVERMETVVHGVNGRAVGNKPLSRSLARAKELMYDADDVVDELDYCRLQQQVEGAAIEQEGMVGDGAEQVDGSANTVVMLAPAVEPEGIAGDGDNRDGAEHVAASASTSTAGISGNNARKNRSKERDYFHITQAANGQPARAKCIDCGTQVAFSHGTSVLRKHRNSASCKKKRATTEEELNCPSAGYSVQNGATVSTNDTGGRKRMRIEYSVATTTHLWDMAEFFKRIHEIVLELQIIRGDVIEYLKDSVTSSVHYQSNSSDTRVRTSSSPPGNVYGRYLDKDNIIRAIKASKLDRITVLPIVGIIGVGKTTLAKLAYHDQHVESKFERIWVWVSNNFDEVRVIREILDVVTMASHEGPSKRESYEGVSNYSKLLEVLKKHMACLTKKFLLVLDDVCDSMLNSLWKDLLGALGSSCTKGNVIIVTTRNLSIAKRLGTIESVELRALGNDDLFQLFRACAFGDNNCNEHFDTGLQICAKLKGNPLAAKSAVEMLREQPTLDHWENIIKNGVWESLQLRGGIVTALKNIYYHLPYHLQQCFLVCSIFPNDHQFHFDGLVSMWISLGFAKSVDIGRDYLNALVNLCFFEQVGTEGDSVLQQCYVMCGMMHEFARLVPRTEFATIEGLECKEMLLTVRHLLIQTDLVYHVDECENIVGNMKFEEKLQSIASSLQRLRTVILVRRYDSSFFQFDFFHTFISNLVNCTHLRYLKLENKGKGESLPISLSKFYHLEILDDGCQAIVHDMSDLISMRHLVLTKGACGAFSPARSASLQTIHLEDCKGWQIIPSLESLWSLAKLKLRNMPAVTELSIPSLEELVLIDMPKLNSCFTNSLRDLNSRLRILEIRRCQVLMSFPLFKRGENFEIEQNSWLPNVFKLTVHECPHLMVSNLLPPSSRFCILSIKNVSTFPNMEGSSNGEMKIGRLSGHSIFNESMENKLVLSLHNLRTITQLRIVRCENLSYFSIEGLRQLICLKTLEIYSCNNFFCSGVLSTRAHEDTAAVPSLECLIITECGITGEWLSVMLQHLRALEELHLDVCQQITGLLIEGKENSSSNLTSTPRASSQGNSDGASTTDKLLCIPSNLVRSLKKMSIKNCPLKFQGNREGFSGFTSLEELKIFRCPELIPSLVNEDEIDDQANGSTTHIEVRNCPGSGLPQYLESLSMRGYELCPRLQRLRIDDPYFLTMPFCKHLTSLQCLQLQINNDIDTAGLTWEQEAALQLLKSLQELVFFLCIKLSDLPVGLHSLSSLKRLEISYCPSISRLPERGLPSSLEELEVRDCRKELTEQCRTLAKGKLRIIIDNEYVN